MNRNHFRHLSAKTLSSLTVLALSVGFAVPSLAAAPLVKPPIQSDVRKVQEPRLPDPEALAEYERRLYPRKACELNNDCSQIQSVEFRRDGALVVASFEVHSQSDSWVLLPTIGGGQWVLSNEKTMSRRLANGGVALKVDKGVSKVEISLKPIAGEMVIGFSSSPKFVRSNLLGWKADFQQSGEIRTIRLLQDAPVDSDGKKDKKPVVKNESAKFDAPLFLSVARSFNYDATGALETISATRLSPSDRPASYELPLYEGEKLQTEGVLSADGKSAKLDFPQGVSSVSLTARWAYKGSIELMANKDSAFKETWQVSQWAKAPLKFTGIQAVNNGENNASLVFMPHPGDKLSMEALPIVPAPGLRLAVDSFEVQQSTGEDKERLIVSIQARSTMTEPMEFEAVEGLTLVKATNNGKIVSATKSRNAYTFELHPGQNSLSVEFTGDTDKGLFIKSPSFKLNAPLANLAWKLSIPSNQWVLLAGGPFMGPAVMFWGVALAMGVLSFLLAKSVKANYAPNFWGWFGILIPLSALSPWSVLVVVSFIFLLSVKEKKMSSIKDRAWNSMQLALMVLGVLSSLILLAASYQGLLGAPDMLVTGNNSHAHLLNWYYDKAALGDSGKSLFFDAWVITVPMLAWRVAMLGWALWMVSSIAKRLPNIWRVLNQGGLWRKSPAKPKKFSPSDTAAEPAEGADENTEPGVDQK